jgi:hypothetical protein
VRELIAAIPHRRFSRISAIIQQVVRASFSKITAQAIRKKPIIPEHIERPPLPTEDEILQVLDLPVAREILSQFD